jgi:hypothetical protein
MPADVREKLFAVEGFKHHFEKEISKISHEKEYRARIDDLLKEFYSNHDNSAIKDFLQ